MHFKVFCDTRIQRRGLSYRQAAVPILRQLRLPIISSFASHVVLLSFGVAQEHSTLVISNPDGAGWADTQKLLLLVLQLNKYAIVLQIRYSAVVLRIVSSVLFVRIISCVILQFCLIQKCNEFAAFFLSLTNGKTLRLELFRMPRRNQILPVKFQCGDALLIKFITDFFQKLFQ